MTHTTAKAPTVNITGRLIVDDESIAVGQIGPNFVVLATPRAIRAGDAQVVVSVLGRDHVYHVYMPHGSDGSSELVEFF